MCTSLESCTIEHIGADLLLKQIPLNKYNFSYPVTLGASTFVQQFETVFWSTVFDLHCYIKEYIWLIYVYIIKMCVLYYYTLHFYSSSNSIKTCSEDL